ncbi:unnamed protein product [Candidula unifasciata]|uniref:Uncharacterized protein n=1 Tax=Candidula unifasciata TaxID=100452 RepID=A0A8S3ZAE2_9EUPU|nr:unnamed protein product [Candidula unifasciata]
MTTERLTQTRLEQYELILANLHITPDAATSQRKESLALTRPHNHLFNRRESTRRTSSAIHEQTSSQLTRRTSNATHQQTSSQSERKSSRSMPSTASHQSAALSVFRVIQAARNWKRLSRRHQTTQEKPKPRLENTYRLGPDPEKLFNRAKVEVVIEDVFNRLLKNFKNSSGDSKDRCLLISAEILRLVKHLDFQRYKIVCNVIIMQNKGQGSEVASRCVWNSEMDSSASVTRAIGDIVCVANVHAMYFE